MHKRLQGVYAKFRGGKNNRPEKNFRTYSQSLLSELNEAQVSSSELKLKRQSENFLTLVLLGVNKHTFTQDVKIYFEGRQNKF